MSAQDPIWDRAFLAPLLAGLDARAREELGLAGRVVRLGAGETWFAPGEPADSVGVVVEGELVLQAVRRGDETPRELRRAGVQGTLGEEALIRGASRFGYAVATAPTCLAELPAALLARVAARAGVGGALGRELAALERVTVRDVLRTSSLGRELVAEDLDVLVDGARWVEVPRGEALFLEGETAMAAHVVASGRLRLEGDAAGKVRILGWAQPGDLLGDEELLAAAPRAASAVAEGSVLVVEVAPGALRWVASRSPDALARARRFTRERGARALQVHESAARFSTRHVLRDRERVELARELLVIDLERCVRCGHCATACADRHGASRLVRRGDVVEVEVPGATGEAATLLLPSSCQQCRDPSCLPECPTGALGRDPGGDVFVRPELCTGCGACVRACPWENLRLVPRERPPSPDPLLARLAAGASSGVRARSAGARAPGATPASADVAVKCDLCRGFDAAACVSACPVDALFRVEPGRDFGEVARWLGRDPGAPGPGARRLARRTSDAAVPLAYALALPLTVFAATLHHRGAVTPGRGIGLAAGVVAASLVVGLAAYFVQKRGWHRVRPDGSSKGGSRVAAARRSHLLLGALVLPLVALHAGAAFPATLAGLLLGVWSLTTGIGVVGAIAAAVLPRRLARLEREGLLDEDLAAERARLDDELHLRATGRSDLVKTLLGRVLLPWARRPLGGIATLLAGRSLRDERRRLLDRCERVLGGRGEGRLEGLEELARIAVELRVLGVRRAATWWLGRWTAAHLLLGVVLLVLLAAHAAGSLWRLR